MAGEDRPKTKYPTSRPMKTFIEIGVSTFETLQPLLDTGWFGIMVEPLPESFDAIPYHHNLIKENVAIDVKNGVETFLTLHNFDIYTQPDIVMGMCGFEKSFTPLHDEIYQYNKKRIEVKTMTLDSLIEKHSIKEIDLLKVDTEGHDVEILMNYSFVVKPRVLKFEHIHVSGIENDYSLVGLDQVGMTKKYHNLLERLKQMGYYVWIEQENVYCVC
jgi:FkbM family methyltransferase